MTGPSGGWCTWGCCYTHIPPAAPRTPSGLPRTTLTYPSKPQPRRGWNSLAPRAQERLRENQVTVHLFLKYGTNPSSGRCCAWYRRRRSGPGRPSPCYHQHTRSHGAGMWGQRASPPVQAAGEHCPLRGHTPEASLPEVESVRERETSKGPETQRPKVEAKEAGPPSPQPTSRVSGNVESSPQLTSTFQSKKQNKQTKQHTFGE